MANPHDKWKKEMAEQGQTTFEEMGIDFSESVEANPDWWNHVSKLRYSGQNLLAAFQLGLQSALLEDPQEEFESFVEKIVGIKRANKRQRESAKARRK
jgi:hypothetical protein